MNRKLSIALAATTSTAALAIGACAPAASSASLGSVSSLCGSSMSSAARGETHHHYSSDVRAATQSAIAAGASEGEVLRSVSRVAERYGISDWEAQSSTYVAIGAGLKAAGEEESSAVSLAGDNGEALDLMLEGYRS
jgi:hypothetical protein